MEVRKAVQLISGTTIESNPKLADFAWPGAHKRLGCVYDHREQVKVIECVATGLRPAALTRSITSLHSAVVLSGLISPSGTNKVTVRAAEFAVRRPCTYRFPWLR